MEFKVILGIILAGILSNNIALLEFLGTGAVLENERSTKKSLALGLGTTIVMVLSTVATWPLNHYLLEKVPYLQTMAFVLVVLVIVEILHIIGKRILDNYCRADFVKFAINGAVLGLCIHNVHHSYLEAIITAAGIGIGFMLTMTLFAKLKDVPVDSNSNRLGE